MSSRKIIWYEFDNFRLDVETQRLLKNDVPVTLSPKTFQTLLILVENDGKTVEKDEIYNKLWSDSFVEEGNMTQHIYILRKSLGQSVSGQSYIETVTGHGYRFTAQVKAVRAQISVESQAETGKNNGRENNQSDFFTKESKVEKEAQLNGDFFSPDFHLNGKKARQNGQPAQSGYAPQVEKSKFQTGKRLSAALLLLLIAGVGSYVYFANFQTKPVNSVEDRKIKSIAVLPFKVIGEESANEHLGLGMTDAIITRLSKLKQIPVRPTRAIFRYIEQPALDIAAAGRDLGVDAILEGTVQRDGERVRVSVRLINIVDGKSLWADTFDEKFTDIFALQDSISGKVAQSLELELTPQQRKLLAQHITNKPEAFEAYQTGVYFWNTPTKENLNKAAGYFQKAVELDPDFARAFGMLADTYHSIGFYGFSDRAEMYEKSRVTAARALALDDSIAEAHIATGAVQTSSGNFEEALKSIERAVEIAPYNSTVRNRHAWILFRFGRKDEAVNEIRLAQEYDPLSSVSNGALCGMLVYQENFDEAVKACEKSFELSPEAADVRLRLAYAYFYSGRTEEAIKLAEIDAEKSDRKFASLGTVGYFYAKVGRHAEAEAIVRQLKPEAGKDAALFIDLTLINYVLGRKDESFEYFQKAREKGFIGLLSYHNDPMWKDVREDSRFAKLMEQ